MSSLIALPKDSLWAATTLAQSNRILVSISLSAMNSSR
jgi:hypothetical protein